MPLLEDLVAAWLAAQVSVNHSKGRRVPVPVYLEVI